MTANRPLRKLTLGLATIALMVAAACTSDSPSEPSRTPGTPPGTGGGGTTYNVTVTVSPTSVAAGATDPVLVTVRATRTDNGQPAPTGTTAILSAQVGSFGAVGGANTATVTLTNGTVQVQYFAPETTTLSSVTIQANVAGSIGQALLGLDEEITFFVSFVEPNFGSPQGGDEVTVNGAGFEAPARVLFGGVNAQVLSVSPTRIRVRTPPSSQPPDQRTTVAVAVTIDVNGADEASDTIAGGFTYTPGGGGDVQPAIFSLTPGTGPNEGGTRVEIVGEGFQAPVQVEFGTAGTFLEAEVLSVTSTRIEVRTPAATGFGQALQNQSVTVRVRNLNSGLTATRADIFRYGVAVLITGFSPGTGPIGGGQAVTVFGQGFDAPAAVSVAGVGGTVLSVTGTELVVRTSAVAGVCGDVSGPISMTNLETGAGASSGTNYTYRVADSRPLVFDILPPTGVEAGGTAVTLTGENLGNVLTTFGGRPASELSAAADGSSVTVSTPFLPRAEFATEACDDNADGAQGVRFIPTAVDVTVTDRVTTCTFTFPDGFSYAPADASCRNDVGPVDPDPECSDGIDNDMDGDIDFPDDAECTDADDDDESA